MKYLLSSYTKHTWVVYMGYGGGKVGTRSRICWKGWAVWVTRGVHVVTKLCLSLLWIILGWISRRWDVGIWTGLGWPRIETGGGRL